MVSSMAWARYMVPLGRAFWSSLGMTMKIYFFLKTMPIACVFSCLWWLWCCLCSYIGSVRDRFVVDGDDGEEKSAHSSYCPISDILVPLVLASLSLSPLSAHWGICSLEKLQSWKLTTCRLHLVDLSVVALATYRLRCTSPSATKPMQLMRGWPLVGRVNWPF